jgi:dihydropteroate synthase
MAIINCTPDSFHQDSRVSDKHAGLHAAELAVQHGADMLDIGGESTRPGAARVDADEQLRRVLPVIEAIRNSPSPLCDTLISIDTTLSKVAQACLSAGADAVNDVSGGQDDPQILRVAAQARAGLVLMHRPFVPEADQYSDAYTTPPVYSDVVAEVIAALRQATTTAQQAGVRSEAILWDPGLGFGKGLQDTLTLIERTSELLAQGFPVLSGTSRKSFVGRVSLGRDSTPSERLAGSLAFSVTHLWHGARLFRVHDVGPQREALAAAWALIGRNPS